MMTFDLQKLLRTLADRSVSERRDSVGSNKRSVLSEKLVLLPLWMTILMFMFVCLPSDVWADQGDLILCGAEEVFVLDPAAPTEKKWTWRANQSATIPVEFHRRFRSTDDCKPYQGNLLLITSSSGAVALIDRATKECRFLAASVNAHSACLLPDDQIAVASSTGGDQLQFFRRSEQQKPASLLQSIPLAGAHGTVWDSKRKCLWALGERELLAVVADRTATPQARWTVRSRHPLPTFGGHDLSPMHDDTRLFVTTNREVLMFDCDAHSFTAADGFGDQREIKSVDLDPISGRLVFHQASTENWWSDTIRFEDQDAIILSKERLYKVRWDRPAPIPQ